MQGTWTQLPAQGLPQGRVRAIAIGTQQQIYAVVSGLGVFKSVDGGASFTKVGRPAAVNDLPAVAMSTLTLNNLGEPVVGVVAPGTGLGSEFLYRFDSAANQWMSSTTSAPINIGGYFPVAFRHDVDGSLLSSWPFRPDIMRSTDNGATWAPHFPIPNATHTPPNGPSAAVKAVYGVASHPLSGELFCGTEGDQWWHSTDRGTSWSMLDAGGTSNLALEPGQNGFLVAFNKDGEPLVGTQGKADGNFLMRVTSDGRVVSSNSGFGAWAMVGTATMGTVLRELVLTQEGHNFLAMPINNGAGGSFPPNLFGSVDGNTWMGLNAPFVPELNALAAYGESVLVGGGATSAGMIWKFTPVVRNHTPRVSTGIPAGESVSAPIAGLMLNGSAVDPDGNPLSFTWKARGPGSVTFSTPGAAASWASFSAPGDHVLTLHASDGDRSAGAPLIVHVTAN